MGDDFCNRAYEVVCWIIDLNQTRQYGDFGNKTCEAYLDVQQKPDTLVLRLSQPVEEVLQARHRLVRFAQSPPPLYILIDTVFDLLVNAKASLTRRILDRTNCELIACGK